MLQDIRQLRVKRVATHMEYSVLRSIYVLVRWPILRKRQVASHTGSGGVSMVKRVAEGDRRR